MIFQMCKKISIGIVLWSLTACNARFIDVPGEKNGHSNKTNMDVIVESSDSVTGYQFRLVPESSPDADCNSSGSYGPMLPVGTHLIEDFSGKADGQLKLCVKIKAVTTVNQEGQPPQTTSYSFIKSASWNKDTVPPGAFAITGPSGTQTNSKPVITWSESEGAATYNIDITSDAACENVYKSYKDIVGTSYEIAEGLANGFWHICIKSEDLASNQTPATNNGILMTVDAPFQYIFATSQSYSASEIGSISLADEQCTLYAFIGNLIPDWDGVSIVYKSVLSDASLNAKDRLALNRSIFNRNNQFVTFGNGLWSGSLEGQPIIYDENGSLIGEQSVWTGTGQDGLYAGSSCSNWSSNSGIAMSGLTDKEDSRWISNIDANCSESKRIYCVGPY